MKTFRLVPLVTLLALGLAGCGPQKDKAPPKPKVAVTLPVLGMAPAWKLKDLNGNVVSSEQFKGKVVVLDFWATWCGPCRMEIPGYIALQKKYGKDALAVVGVSLDEEGAEGETVSAVVKSFVAKSGVNYQVVLGNDEIQTAFGGLEAIPTTFLIDRSGQLRDKKVGVEAADEYERKVMGLLK